MNAIDFVVRTRAGALERGSVGGEGQGFLIDAGAGSDIFLNISQSDLRGYDRAGDDLLITLADGRVIVLEGYFDGGEGGNRLFLSADGILNEVSFVEAEGGALFAQYGPTETWGKWSPSDELIFIDEPTVVADGAYPATGDGDDGEVSMLAAGLLVGGSGLLGIGGGDGDGGSDWIPPTVNDADAAYALNGEDVREVRVTGTANPGSEVTVIIGDDTVTVIADEDRGWEAVFDGDRFPEDGTYEDIDVVVTDPDGTVTELDGPTVIIDTTPPLIDVTDGAVSNGDLFNAEQHEEGVSISGTGEVGATVTVTIGDSTQTTTVDENGDWSVAIDDTVLPEGEYISDVVITAEDDFGNTTTINDQVQIDTVAHPITIGTVGGDNLINGAEADAGFQITGTSTPGASVTVTFADLTETVVVAEDGTWVLDVTSDDFPGGEYIAEITATTVDAAGNPSSASSTLEIDIVSEVTLTNTPLTGDDLISGAELEAGLVLTGTTQVGSVVEVTIEGVTQTATVAADGSWTVTFPNGSLPTGVYDSTATVTATDTAGNVATTTHGFSVDTETTLSIDTGSVAGDGIINLTESQSGVALTGTAEAGASVTVTVGDASFDTTAEAAAGVTLTGTTQPGSTVVGSVSGQDLAASVAADGSWSVVIQQGLITVTEGALDVAVTSTDAAGNVATASGSVMVDLETMVAVADGLVEGDGVVNADERADDVPLTGIAEAGAAIAVTVAGSTFDTTADASGNWSITIPAALVPEGETSLPVSVLATDVAGNTATAQGSIAIDTVTTVTLVTDTVEGDGVINATEQADGVTLTGTAEAGASVTVTTGGQQLVTTAAADGSWSVNVPASAVPTGVTTMDVTVSATDAAGNTQMTAGSVAVDTETALTMDDDAVEGDGVVNAAERADGVLLTGQAEPGAAVSVTVQGTVRAASVAADGSWSVTIPAALVPEGETSLPVSAMSADVAGNTATVSGTIRIDTETEVSVRTGGVEGDGIVNAAEYADGVVLTGNAEPGASVMVTMGAITHAATVAADGSWTASFSAAEIPTGETSLPVTAIATDAAGNSATANGTVQVDTLVRNFAITSDTGGADGVVNAEEAAQGITLTGTTEPGGSVVVTLDRATQNATVDADGNWTVTFTAGQLPQGEQTVTLTAVSTDIAGNSETLTQSVIIDTDAGLLTIDPDPIETDDVVNYAEAADGVVITGTSNPGQMVTVTLGGVSHVVQTGANGAWSASYTAAEIAPGTYTADITATITDSAGNTLTRTDSVEVDTEVLNFGVSGDPVTGDGVINASEAGRGVTLAGTTEQGGTVEVVIDGIAYDADVAADGSWEVTFPASAFNANDEYGVTATINTTDAAGNTATTTTDLTVDTWVHRLNMTAADITPDNVVNALEAQDGITLAGQVELGSVVEVTMGGVVHVATVNQNGYWTVDIPGSSIPRGTLDAPVMIEATDPAGNVRTITETVSIDTDLPDSPVVESYTRDHTGLRGVSLETTADDIQIGHVVSDTSVEEVGFSADEIPALGETSYAFSQVVPDGSHLVIASTDDAGNTSGTYLVVDDTRTSEVTMTDALADTLSEFQIEKIDLQFAEDSAFTITEAQLVALSDHTDTLIVEGGADDSVTITGAQAAGTTAQGNTSYNVFTLGDATLLIEDDITNVVI